MSRTQVKRDSFDNLRTYKSEETTVPQDLHNLDETFLVKIIKDYLIKQGKAQLLIDENNEIGGVKIV